MRKRNRLASIIITAALMIALLPATAFAADYDLWVGGVRVTDTNKDNITGTPGAATFDSDTNTLTLNNYSYTGVGYEFDNAFGAPSAAAIYSGLESLSITMNGANCLTNNATDKNSYGIYANSQLEITEESSGSLDVIGGDTSKRSIGIYIYDNDFEVNGGKVTTVGGEAASDDLSTGVWCFDGNIIVGENTELIGIGGDAGISRGISAFGQIINNGGTIEGTGGNAGSISHGISAGSIESNNTNSKIIGTAGAAKESAGIRIWNSSTLTKGYMKGVGGDVDINNNDVSYGIYVGDSDSEKLTVVKGATVEAEGETAAFNKAYAVADPGEAAPGTAAQPDSSPDTGDNSNMILWLALLLVSGGAIIVAVVLGRKRK